MRKQNNSYSREQKLRSELQTILNQHSWIRGTISKRKRTCGKPTCACSRGQKHSAVYLLTSNKGKTEQLYIPKQKQDYVMAGVQSYKRIKKLLNVISDLNLRKIS